MNAIKYTKATGRMCDSFKRKLFNERDNRNDEERLRRRNLQEVF